MSGRGGGYAAHSGVQPNHQSQRNFSHGSARTQGFSHQTRPMMTANPPNMPQVASNANNLMAYAAYPTSQNIMSHMLPQVPRFQIQQQGALNYPQTFVHPYYYAPMIYTTPYGGTNRNPPGSTSNATYTVAAPGMPNSAENATYPIETGQFHQPIPGPIHTSTASNISMPPQPPVQQKPPSKPTKRLQFFDPSTNEPLTEEYLLAPATSKPEPSKPIETSSTTTRTTTRDNTPTTADNTYQRIRQDFMESVYKVAASPSQASKGDSVSGSTSESAQDEPNAKPISETSESGAQLTSDTSSPENVKQEPTNKLVQNEKTENVPESDKSLQPSDSNDLKKEAEPKTEIVVVSNQEKLPDQVNIRQHSDQKKDPKGSVKPSETQIWTAQGESDPPVSIQSSKSSSGIIEESAKTATQAQKGDKSEQTIENGVKTTMEAEKSTFSDSNAVQEQKVKDSASAKNSLTSSTTAHIEAKNEILSGDLPLSPTPKEIPISSELPSVSLPEAKNEKAGNAQEAASAAAPAMDVVDHEAVLVTDVKAPASLDVVKPKDAKVKESSEKASKAENKESSKENDKPEEEVTAAIKANSKGKYEYKADFLRSLQSHPLSLKKPDLPDLDIVQEVPIPQREKQRMNNDFLPAYMNPGRSNRSLPPRIGNRPSIERRPPKPPIKIIPSPPLTQDVELHTVENAWKPAIPALKPVDAADEEEKKTVELVKRFRGILNKLTPQKYEDLIKQIDTLVIDTEDRLNRVLELIFDKAVDEPAFCTDYAKLCKHISKLKITKQDTSNDKKDENSEKDEKSTQKQFRQLLLQKCQMEFESEIYKDIDIDGREKQIAAIQDPEKKRIAYLELEEDKRKARKRTLGIIKFIGELYMFEMLRVVIMDSCINKLLTQEDDESLECLCTLLRTVGAKWERDNQQKNKTHMLQMCITKLETIVKKKVTSSRVRFMIQDVIDMRKEGWKLRKLQDENKPKTIEQLHLEIKQEEATKIHEIQQHIIKTGDSRKAPSRQEEWNLQRNSRGNTPGGNQILESLRNLPKNPTSFDNVSLAPCMPSAWGTGARLGQSQSQRSQNSDTFSGRNSLNERDKNARSGGNNMGRDASEGRTTSSGPPPMRPYIPSQEEESYSGYPGRTSSGNRMPPSVPAFSSDVIKKATSSRSSSMEKSGVSDSRSSNTSVRRESPKKEPSQGTKLKVRPELTEDQVYERAQNIIKEYFSHGDKKEAQVDVIELCNENNIHKFIEGSINVALELSSHDQRVSIGELLLHLVQEKVIKLEQFRKVLHSTLEIASDLLVDIPRLWEYLGELLVPLFCNIEDSNRKNFFVKALEPCKNDGGAALTMYYILNSSKANPKSPYVCASAWTSGGLDWSAFLPKNKSPEEFFQSHELKLLDFTVSSDILGNKIEQFCKFLHENSEDELINYLSKNFKPAETLEPSFVRALTKAAVEKCLIKTVIKLEKNASDFKKSEKNSTEIKYTLDEKFEKYCTILAKFLGGTRELELATLHTLQSLMGEYENPKGVLMDIFESLHNTKAVSDEAFLEWEQFLQNPLNKGPAVYSVKSFLTKIKEGGSESDS